MMALSFLHIHFSLYHLHKRAVIKGLFVQTFALCYPNYKEF